MNLTVNGMARSFDGDPEMPLLWYLRDVLRLTGTKYGCGVAQCGACTVHLDGRSVKSCNVLAVQADGCEVTTIEGMATDGELHPVQAAFHECHALQCGYCTPGQICSAVGMANEATRGLPSNVTPDLAAETIDLDHDELRERMSGNLCRCGAHNGIVDAIFETYGEDRLAEAAE